MKANGFTLLWMLIGVSVAGIVTLSFKAEAQKSAFRELQGQRAALQQAATDKDRLKSISIDPAEMERLRRETAVLLRLRNEYNKLSRDGGDSVQDARTPDALQKVLDEREDILNEEHDIQRLSDRAACIKTLELIAVAKERWASDNAAEKGLPVTMDNLMDYVPEHVLPVCPAGGHYSVNRIGAAPVCSVGGHSIP